MSHNFHILSIKIITDILSSILAQWLMDCMKKQMNLNDDEPKPESVLDEVSFEGIARYIKSDKCKNIITMAGAGISTCKSN